LIPIGGKTYQVDWAPGTSRVFKTYWDLNELFDDNMIYDTTRLGLVTFVQNDNNEGSREVYQAVFNKLPNLQENPITGLEEEINLGKIESANLYPNPAQDYFQISLGEALTMELDWVIIDQLGVELKRGKFKSGGSKFDIDTRRIPDGLHMFIVSSGTDFRTIKKIVIQH